MVEPKRTSDFSFVDWAAFGTDTALSNCADLAKTVIQWLEREHDRARQEDLAWLFDVLSLQLPWDPAPGEGLGPVHLFARLQRHTLLALVRELPRIGTSTPELRVRIIDAAWQKQRACSHVEVREAVELYLLQAERHYDSEHWVDTFVRLQRAVMLAASLGPAGDLLKTAMAAVDITLDRCKADASHLPARLLELLLQYRHGLPEERGKLATRIASKCAVDGDYERAVQFFDIAARWYQAGKCADRVREARERIGELLETQAAAAEPALACHLLMQAIENARQIPGSSSRAERLRTILQQRQRENVAQFATYETTIDLSDCAAQTRAQVTGKGSAHALIALCGLRIPAPVEEVRQRVLDSLKAAPFRLFIPQVTMSASGRVLNTNNGLMDDPDATTAEMFRDVTFHQQIFARGGIRPAVRQIQIEHGLRIEDMMSLAHLSPFVPPGRVVAFARGLHCGLYEDFSVAAQLLIPQLENAIRVLLEQAGAVTTTLTTSGIQNEIDLNALLVHPKAEEVFGEAQVFDLRALLTEKTGANLRNELAHGLLDDGVAEEHMAYAWWVTLRFVLSPLIRPAGQS